MENNKQSFMCYKCNKENIFKPSEYMDGQEFFLEAAGTAPSKDVVITCKYCNSENEVTLTP